MDESKEKDPGQIRQESLMAIRDPRLAWRLKALRAGYVPTLLPERIPQEIQLYLLRLNQDNHHLKLLGEHAKKFRSWERKTAVKVFGILLIGFLLLAGLSMAVTLKRGYSFNIPLFNVLIPRSESGIEMESK